MQQIDVDDGNGTCILDKQLNVVDFCIAWQVDGDESVHASSQRKVVQRGLSQRVDVISGCQNVVLVDNNILGWDEVVVLQTVLFLA